MPSPFPGMDPFIENQGWAGFHTHLITNLADALVPQARPRYTVRIEERTYIEHEPEDRARHIRPDAVVLARETMTAYQTVSTMTETNAPVILTLPPITPESEHESYLVVRNRETSRVITVIEVLALGNKRAGSNGRRKYLDKRDRVLESTAHLVELDLLRGGERLPTIEPLPAADYYAFISRAQRRPKIDVYAWSLRAPLPTLPIPLDEDVPEMTLDLQSIFTHGYDSAGYDYSLDYKHAIQPPLAPADADWITTRLQAQPA